MVLTAIVSVQMGAGVADRLFRTVPPAGVTALRLWSAALILLAFGARPITRAITSMVTSRDWRRAATVAGFGLALACMNYCIYQAFARIPLGIAVTIEFLGPLSVAIAGSRKLRDLAWAGLAAIGVVLLTNNSGAGQLNLAGIAFGVAAAAGWAAYILASKATGRSFPGRDGLAIAMCVAAVLVTAPGITAGGAAMFRPGVLGTGAAIGLLSSVIPYWLELEVLRRTPARLFGVWMSAEPAVAALIGLALLGQRLSLTEWAAVCCVMIACGGASAGLHFGRARSAPQARRTGSAAYAALDARAGDGRCHRQRGHNVDWRGGTAQLLRAGLPGLAQVHGHQPGGHERARPDGGEHRHRVRQPAAQLPAVRDRGPGIHGRVAVQGQR
jgi:inner membrane transporter RhtA